MESLFGCRRRFKKKISVLLWWFGNNSLPPCSSRTFWEQSHWSYVTGQCGDWDWNIPLRLPHWMCIQSSFYYQQWIDTWRSRFEQKTDSILLANWSKGWKSRRPWTYWFLCTTSRAIRAQCMEEASRRGILGWCWSCDQRRINILSNTIECNYSSREHFQLIAFQKLKDWKLEKSCMKDDICLLDHHQRSHCNTITIGPKGMINWVLQLNNSQLENSLNSVLEEHHVLSFPNQPDPNPIQSVIDRRNLNVFLLRKEKSPVHKRSMINVCKKNLVLQIEQGNLWSLKTFASCMLTMEQGKLWNRAQAHRQWKNSFLPNIVTLHHLTRTSSTLQPTRRISISTSQECRIRWWNDHMASTFTTWFSRSRTTLIDKHFKVIFNNIDHSTLSVENHKMRSKLLGTLNYAR